MTDDINVALLAEPMLMRRMTAALMREVHGEVIEAAGVEEMVAACADRPMHVLVISWTACGAGTPGAIRRLRSCAPRARIVVVLPNSARDAVRAAMAAGAAGVACVSQLSLTLPIVVRAVALGQVCVSESVRREVEPPILSHRERQMLAGVADGLTNAAIAHQLCLSESTVKSHLSSLFAKLGVHSRAEAVAVANGEVPR
jgi:DNA-binding NarL/FixJ family response regulator